MCKIDWSSPKYRSFLDVLEGKFDEFRTAQRKIDGLNETKKALLEDIEELEEKQAVCLSEDVAKIVVAKRNRVSEIETETKNIRKGMPKFWCKNLEPAYTVYCLEFYKHSTAYEKTAAEIVAGFAWEYGVELDNSVGKALAAIIGSKSTNVKKYDETGANLAPVSKQDFAFKVHAAIMDRFTQNGLKSTKELRKKAEEKARRAAEYAAKHRKPETTETTEQ